MLRLLLAAPLLLLILFALSNAQIVHLGLWPLPIGIDLPVSIAVLTAVAFGMLLGALMLWLPALGLRRRARRAEQASELLENQIRELKARAPSAVLPPPE